MSRKTPHNILHLTSNREVLGSSMRSANSFIPTEGFMRGHLTTIIDIIEYMGRYDDDEEDDRNCVIATNDNMFNKKNRFVVERSIVDGEKNGLTNYQYTLFKVRLVYPNILEDRKPKYSIPVYMIIYDDIEYPRKSKHVPENIMKANHPYLYMDRLGFFRVKEGQLEPIALDAVLDIWLKKMPFMIHKDTKVFDLA